MSCGCGCGGHGGCGDARAYAPRRRRPYYTGRLRRRGHEPEYMAASGPGFGARMSFAAALANSATNSTGLYRIYKNGRPVYAGRAAPGTIRSRLINHRWCLTHMGVDDAAYTVSFAPMSGSSTAQVVTAEKDEIRRMRRNRVHRGTNVREGELEWMLGRESMAGKPGQPRKRGTRKRPAAPATRATVAPFTSVAGRSCREVFDNCLESSPRRKGRVSGEARCLSCFNYCEKQGGDWKDKTGAGIRCDYWR